MNGIFASLMVVTGVVGASPEQTWHDDYAVALREARAARRPILIVLQRPDRANRPVDPANFRAEAAESELLAHFELCRIDVTTEYGKSIAEAFKATEFPYTAITDKSVKLLIFRKAGRLAGDEWTATLATYRYGELTPPEPQPRPRICFT
jgi:hypothetical protein